MTKLKSNLDMFARRGDHWTDNRLVKDEYKALEDPFDQGPDMDRWTRASFKKPKEQARKASLVGKARKRTDSREGDKSLKCVGIILKHKLGKFAKTVNVKE